MTYDEAMAALQPGFTFAEVTWDPTDQEPVEVVEVKGEMILLRSRGFSSGWHRRQDLAVSLSEGAAEIS